MMPKLNNILTKLPKYLLLSVYLLSFFIFYQHFCEHTCTCSWFRQRLSQANAITPFTYTMTCVDTSGCCIPPCDLHTGTRTFCVAFQLIFYNHATTNLLQSLVNMIHVYSKIHGGSEQMLHRLKLC